MSIKATALDDYELGNIRKDTEIVETNIQRGPDSAEADIEAIEPNLSNSLGMVPAVSIPVEVPLEERKAQLRTELRCFATLLLLIFVEGWNDGTPGMCC